MILYERYLVTYKGLCKCMVVLSEGKMFYLFLCSCN